MLSRGEKDIRSEIATVVQTAPYPALARAGLGVSETAAERFAHVNQTAGREAGLKGLPVVGVFSRPTTMGSLSRTVLSSGRRFGCRFHPIKKVPSFTGRKRERSKSKNGFLKTFCASLIRRNRRYLTGKGTARESCPRARLNGLTMVTAWIRSQLAERPSFWWQLFFVHALHLVSVSAASRYC